MTTESLLGTTFACRCGREHHVPTETLVYAEDAYAALPGLVRRRGGGEHSSCLVIADSRTLEVAGTAVIAALEEGGIAAGRYIVADRGGESPATDDRTRDLLLAEAPAADIYLAVGSGVINDLVKWLAHLRDRPYIAVATAASMNGYASANVAATIDGLKMLFHAAAPRAVLARPSVIASAPHELSMAGLGDVLAKTVSSADWKLNQFLFGDYYCQFAVDLLKDLEPVYLDNPAQLRNGEAAGFAALFRALFYSSVAMTVTGTSSPASGGEHLISHTLDILAGRDGLSHDYHGRQVGVGSILTAALYEQVLAIDSPRFRLPGEDVDAEFWGVLTPVVAPEFAKKRAKLEETAALLSKPDNWHSLRRLLLPRLLPAARLKNCLKEAGGAHRYHDLRFAGRPLEKDFFCRVVRNASRMRARFTILDLAEMLGLIPAEGETIIERVVGA